MSAVSHPIVRNHRELKFNSIYRYMHQDYSWQKLLLLFLAAFLIRFATFQLYIQHEERYRQADSYDYHLCGLCIKAGYGMTRFDTNEPIFWRTPGYPLFLSIFYYIYHSCTADFSKNKDPFYAAILVQIFLCSWIPLLIFFLTRLLTGMLPLAWISAWISVIHLGFVLASCYILSDALALIFFLGFLYFFYQSFRLWFESPLKKANNRMMIIASCKAALLLALYTWIRPNGQFLVVVVLVSMLIGSCSWRIKFSKIALFALIFFATLSGWYIRNHSITGHWFFCPMSGPYLQTFCAPKIIRRVSGQPLDTCIKYLLSFIRPEMQKEALKIAQETPHLKVCKELICAKIATPWIVGYPWYFICDWSKEVAKTMFDLYASQLVAFVTKTHSFDPPEEFLTEKLTLCLFSQPMPLLMRCICWLEALFVLCLWLGLFAGCWVFLVQPLYARRFNDPALQKIQALWLKSGIIISALIVMTGGFGYARLRMPAEPLMLILALSYWYFLYAYLTQQNHTKRKL